MNLNPTQALGHPDQSHPSYDHNCRTPETVVEKINYCHNNPVARALVAEPGEWRWSSYNWYMGVSDVPLAMDELDGEAKE